MGRKRKKDKHLPQRMYMRRGAYYFVDKDGRWVPLGRDYATAMTEYGRLTGPGQQCVTMQDVIDRYRIDVLPSKAAHTQKDQTRQLTKLGKVFGAMRPDHITTQHVYQYIDARSHYPTATRHEVSLLGHVFVKAIRWGAATKNPARGIEKPRSKPRDRYITDAEFLAVRALAIPSMQVAMEMALLTGLRQGDVLSLTRESLTDDGILIKTSKTGAGLLIQYSPALEAVIDKAKKLKPQVGPGQFLIRNRSGRRYTSPGFKANWQRLINKAMKKGIEHFTFNDIRAKTASDSESLTIASERLAHSSTATTKRFYCRQPMLVKPLK